MNASTQDSRLGQQVAQRLRGLLLGAALVSLVAVGYGQATGTVTGRVLNPATGEYLRNAIVSVVGTDISTTAQSGGSYRLTDVPAGEVQISVSYTGLDTAQAAVAVVAGQTVTHDFSLTSARYDKEVVQLGKIVVSTAREGNAKAVMEQRMAINVKRVIASDAMGNISEGNVGEFLKLMPAVVMDYVEADTRAARVRGLNSKYLNVMLDGMPPANSGSSNIGTGRSFEFEQLSISSVETVELTKAATPDQPSSLGGTVNLTTKSALDRKGRFIGWSAALSTNSYFGSVKKTQGWDNSSHFKLLPNYSLEFYDSTLLGGRLGIHAGFGRNYTMAAQKNVWLFYNDFDADYTNNKTEIPIINRYNYQDGPKPTKRDNFDIRLDYHVSDALRVWGRFGFNNYDAKFYNRTLDLRTELNAIVNAPGSTAPASPYVIYSKTSQSTIASANTRISLDSNQFMQKKGQTVVMAGGAVYQAGDFSATLTGQYTRSNNWYENLKLGHFTDFSASLYGVAWRMERSKDDSGSLFFTELAGPDWRNPSNYTWDPNSIGWHERRSQDSNWTSRIDFRNNFRWSVPVTLKYGAYTNLEARDVHRYGLMQTDIRGADGIRGTADDNPARYVDTSFTPDWGFGGTMNGFPVLSPWALYRDYQAHPTWFVDNTNQILQQRLQNNWYFKEQINAGYFQSIFKVGNLEIAPGVRYEHTNSSGKGAKVLSDAQAAAASGSPAGTAPFVVAKYGGQATGGNSFGNWMKYLHTSYQVSKNLYVKASYHEAITRADMSNLVPGISAIDDTNHILTASNPDLKPELSKNYNLSLEYYFEPVGALSITAFQFNIKNRQFSNAEFLGASGWEGDTTYAGWKVNWQNNVGNVLKQTGIEIDYQQQLSFLPGIWKGLGVMANYTASKYDDWGFWTSTSTPEVEGNLGLSFDYRNFHSRINGNWVGRQLQTTGRSYSIVTNTWAPAAPFAPEYQAARLLVDLNLEYRLNPSLTLFVDARNLFNEPTISTYRATTDDFLRILRTGTVWMVGVKGHF